MHYVIGDVHESYDEMLALMDKIEEKDPNAEFIFVGDFPFFLRQLLLWYF